MSCSEPLEVEVLSVRESRDVEVLTASYFANQLHNVLTDLVLTVATDDLPLARIKRIMKQDSCDPHPRMISADAVPFMAFATKLFIGHLTKIAWTLSSKKHKRNTLQLRDLKLAVASSTKFDFLIDIIDLFDEQKRAEDQAMLKVAEMTSVPRRFASTPLDEGYEASDMTTDSSSNRMTPPLYGYNQAELPVPPVPWTHHAIPEAVHKPAVSFDTPDANFLEGLFDGQDFSR